MVAGLRHFTAMVTFAIALSGTFLFYFLFHDKLLHKYGYLMCYGGYSQKARDRSTSPWQSLIRFRLEAIVSHTRENQKTQLFFAAL